MAYIDRDGVKFILGHASSTPTLAVVQMVAEEDVLLLVGLLAVGLGMMGVILGVVVPGTFLPGVYLIAIGALACGAAGLWLALAAPDADAQEPA